MISYFQKHSITFLVSIIIGVGMLYVEYDHIQNYSTTPKWLFIIATILIGSLFLKNEQLKWSWANLLWFLFVFYCAINAFRSYNFFDAIVRLVPLVVGPIVVSFIANKKKDDSVLRSVFIPTLILLTLPLLFVSIFRIVDLIYSGNFDHQATYLFNYSFGHRNQFSHFLTLMIPLSFLGAINTKSKLRWVYYGAIAVMFFLVIALQNRTSIIVISFVYAPALAAFMLKNIKRRTKHVLAGALLLFVVSLGALLISPYKNSVPLLGNLTETTYGSGNERVRIWKNSLDLVDDNLLVGYGSGDWKIEIERTPLIHTQAEKGDVFYQRAHNEFIQTLVEQGLIGLVILSAFFAVAIFLVIQSEKLFEEKVISVAGIFGFIVIANFSFPLERIELLILLFIFLSPGFKERKIEKKSLAFSVKYIKILALTGLFLFIWFWFDSERKYFEYKRTGNHQYLLEINKEFYSIDPVSAPLYWETGNIYYENKMYQEAIAEYRKAINKNPYHIHTLNNIGSSYYALGKHEKALKFYDFATQLNPGFIESWMNMASLKFNRGDIDGALDAILEVPIDQEPSNYKMYVVAVARAKCDWLIELYDEPEFENFLMRSRNDEQFLYQISVDCRISWRSYEDEMRHYLANHMEKL